MTDLDAIKNQTIAISYIKPTPAGEDEISKLFAVHPFLSDMYWMERALKEHISLETYHFSDGDIYEEWRQQFEHRVNKCKSLIEVYMLWRDPWKLTFMKYCGQYLSKKDFASYLANSWVTEENPNMDVNVSRKEALQMFKKANKTDLMEEDDYLYYQNLPDELDVYRGVGHNRIDLGLSWTDDIEKARWFQNRFGEEKQTKLLTAHIQKDDIIAYFNTRNEAEVLVDVFAIRKQIREI